MPEYLYHYTSIEILALILKFQTIRFNALSNVDDRNETEFADSELNFSPYTFISCWTDSEKENLPFWNMYTPNMRGVRIKMPTIMFDSYIVDSFNIEGIVPNIITQDSFFPKEKFFSEKFWLLSHTTSPYKIHYTDDIGLLKPQIVEYNQDKFTASFGEVGKYKSKIWEFQSEYRFRFYILPAVDRFGNKISPIENSYKIISEIKPIQAYFDVPLKKSSFEKMEITLGPKCSVSEEIIVKSLIKSLNPKAKLEKNKLTGMIR